MPSCRERSHNEKERCHHSRLAPGDITPLIYISIHVSSTRPHHLSGEQSLPLRTHPPSCPWAVPQPRSSAPLMLMLRARSCEPQALTPSPMSATCADSAPNLAKPGPARPPAKWPAQVPHNLVGRWHAAGCAGEVTTEVKAAFKGRALVLHPERAAATASTHDCMRAQVTAGAGHCCVQASWCRPMLSASRTCSSSGCR